MFDECNQKKMFDVKNLKFRNILVFSPVNEGGRVVEYVEGKRPNINHMCETSTKKYHVCERI